MSQAACKTLETINGGEYIPSVIPPIDPPKKIPWEKPGEESSVEERLESLMAQFRPALRGAVAKVRSRSFSIDPEEIEQEVRIRLWKVLEADREIRSPESYIYRMAVNATLDVIRRYQRRREDPMETLEHSSERAIHEPRSKSPEIAAQRRETLIKVERALKDLSEERASCVRYYLQGFTSEEIAHLKRWTEPKARNLTYRGLDQLRRLLKLQGIHYEP